LSQECFTASHDGDLLQVGLQQFSNDIIYCYNLQYYKTSQIHS